MYKTANVFAVLDDGSNDEDPAIEPMPVVEFDSDVIALYEVPRDFLNQKSFIIDLMKPYGDVKWVNHRRHERIGDVMLMSVKSANQALNALRQLESAWQKGAKWQVHVGLPIKAAPSTPMCLMCESRGHWMFECSPTSPSVLVGDIIAHNVAKHLDARSYSAMLASCKPWRKAAFCGKTSLRIRAKSPAASPPNHLLQFSLLKKLDLSDNEFLKNGWLSVLPHLKNVTHLNISNCPQLTYKGLVHVSKMPSLTHLRMSCISLAEDVPIAATIYQVDTPDELRRKRRRHIPTPTITSSLISQNSKFHPLLALLESRSLQRSLKELDISFCKISIGLDAPTPTMPSVKTIDLRGCEFLPNTHQRLLSNFPNASKLAYVDYNMQVILNVLSQRQNVSDLTLSTRNMWLAWKQPLAFAQNLLKLRLRAVATDLSVFLPQFINLEVLECQRVGREEAQSNMIRQGLKQLTKLRKLTLTDLLEVVLNPADLPQSIKYLELVSRHPETVRSIGNLAQMVPVDTLVIRGYSMRALFQEQTPFIHSISTLVLDSTVSRFDSRADIPFNLDNLISLKTLELLNLAINPPVKEYLDSIKQRVTILFDHCRFINYDDFRYRDFEREWDGYYSHSDNEEAADGEIVQVEFNYAPSKFDEDPRRSNWYSRKHNLIEMAYWAFPHSQYVFCFGARMSRQ